jgi:enamine deaminase RidA (YjgF/YER057c/UK114 family)
MTAKTTHLDPEGLHSNPAFTQGVIAPAARTLYVGGQLGTDSTRKLLDGIEAQTTQAMRNVLTVLAAAGTGPEHVVKLNIYLVDGVDAQVGYAASRSVWGAITAQPSRSFPPQDTLAQARSWRSTQ